MAKKSDGAIAIEKHKDGGPDDYEADDAMRSLERAEEVKSNPELMKRVAKKAGRKMKALKGLHETLAKHGPKKPKSIADLKKMRNDMALGSTPDDDYDDVDGG